MGRPSVVWVYTIFVLFGIIYTAVTSIAAITNPYGRMGLPPYEYYAHILTLVLLLPQLIFIITFFMLKKNAMIWLFIAFGLGVVLNLIAQEWLWAVGTAVIGWVIWDYIAHKKVDGQPLFT